MKKQFIHLDNVKIIKKSNMYVMGQTAPYVKIEAEPKNMPAVKKITGIVAVAQNKEKENVLISFNTDGKYSQIIAEQFFKDVK